MSKCRPDQAISKPKPDIDCFPKAYTEPEPLSDINDFGGHERVKIAMRAFSKDNTMNSLRVTPATA